MMSEYSLRKIRVLPVIILAVIWMDAHAQNQRDFLNISVNDGLSQSTIFSIYQDSKGFMWFGTRGGGLNKYNGYDFTVYMNQPDVEGSLSDNTVPAILEDSHGALWVGTGNGGINRFDLNTGRFFTYQLELRHDINPAFPVGPEYL